MATKAPTIGADDASPRGEYVEEGSRFGPYQLIKRIAFGGMAEIHLAKTHGIENFEKLLVLKVIHPKFSEDQEFIDMLVDEAKISVQLSHANVGQIFDLGQIDSTYYIAMEFIDGRDLYQLLVRCSELEIEIPFDIIAFIALEAAAGLHYAHSKSDNYGRPLNLIHRDISPQNILLSYDGEVKIIDFGIAKASQRSKETENGVIKGKFFYMSPEQAWGKTLDSRTDLFSVGVCLYEMITGEMLYSEEKALVLLEKVRKAKIPSMQARRRDLPPDLEKITLRALAREQEDRFQTGGELQGQLSGFLYRNWPGFNRERLKQFMLEVFGDQRFVMALPEKQPEKSLLMVADDFDPTSGESIIFDLGMLDLQEVSNLPNLNQPQAEFPNLNQPQAEFPKLNDLNLDEGDLDDDRTMVAMDYDLDESFEEEAEEMTIAEGVWAMDDYGEMPSTDDDDETAVIDMSLVEAMRATVDEGGEDKTEAFSQEQKIPIEKQPTGNRGLSPQASNRGLGPQIGNRGLNRLAPTAGAPKASVMPQMSPQQSEFQAPRAQQAVSPATVHLSPLKPSFFKRFGLLIFSLLLLLGVLSFAAYRFLPVFLAEEAPKLASVSLESEPPGSQVELDGQLLPHRTPALIENILPGEQHQLLFRKKGYESQEMLLMISPEELNQVGPLKRRVFLRRSPGTLRIESLPSGAEVWLRGAYAGQTPFIKEGIKRSTKEFSLCIKLSDYRDRCRRLKWGDQTELKLKESLLKIGSK